MDNKPDYVSSSEDKNKDKRPGADEHDVGNEMDEAHNAADKLEIEQLEEEQADIVLITIEAMLGKTVLEKVSVTFMQLPCKHRMFLIVCQVLKLASKVFCSPHTCSKLAKEVKLKCETLIYPVQTC